MDKEMNEHMLHIAAIIARSFPFSLLKKGKRLPIVLPFYHTVSDDQNLPFAFNYEYPTIARFEADLDFLLKNFKPIELEDLISGKNLQNCFHLSFDDGLKSCFDTIAPILKQKGIPASFFVNPAFVDNKDLFHRYKASVLKAFSQKRGLNLDLQQCYADNLSLDEIAEDMGVNWNNFLEKEQPYMTLEQIQSLQDDGFTIGAHSWDHPEFWLLDEEHQLGEIRDSMNWVVENLSPRIKAFAFPFSDWGVSNSVFKAINEERICDISFGTAGLKKERLSNHFQRIAMDAPLGRSAIERLKAEYLAFHLKKILGMQITRR